jgi:hypothetical protein
MKSKIIRKGSEGDRQKKDSQIREVHKKLAVH